MMWNPNSTRMLDLDDVTPASRAISLAPVAGDNCDDGCPFCTGPETD